MSYSVQFGACSAQHSATGAPRFFWCRQAASFSDPTLGGALAQISSNIEIIN